MNRQEKRLTGARPTRILRSSEKLMAVGTLALTENCLTCEVYTTAVSVRLKVI